MSILAGNLWAALIRKPAKIKTNTTKCFLPLLHPFRRRHLAFDLFDWSFTYIAFRVSSLYRHVFRVFRLEHVTSLNIANWARLSFTGKRIIRLILTIFFLLTGLNCSSEPRSKYENATIFKFYTLTHQTRSQTARKSVSNSLRPSETSFPFYFPLLLITLKGLAKRKRIHIYFLGAFGLGWHEQCRVQ